MIDSCFFNDGRGGGLFSGTGRTASSIYLLIFVAAATVMCDHLWCHCVHACKCVPIHLTVLQQLNLVCSNFSGHALTKIIILLKSVKIEVANNMV